MRVLLAKHQDKAAAGIIIFSHEDEIFWWSNVSDANIEVLIPRISSCGVRSNGELKRVIG
jgi:hypothetical protein